MIQTSYGPVGLRRPRQPETMTLSGGDRKEVKLLKGWMKATGKKDTFKDETYRKAVKQAMLIAASKVEIEDLSTGRSIDPENGLQRTPAMIRDLHNTVTNKLQAMQKGTAAVPVRRVMNSTGVRAQGVISLQKHLIVKRSNPWGWNKYRYFSIGGGLLKVFKVDEPSAKPKRVYKLSDASCVFETSTMPHISDTFLRGYDARVRVNLRERAHGPVYLYSKDAVQAKSWERAVKMSKYLQEARDREAIAFVIGRVAGTVLAKGWRALFLYAKEIKDTRTLIRSLAMRIMRIDLARGWTKARLVYLQKVESEKLRSEQKKWAAGFLRDKMDRLSNQMARTPKMVRHSIISKVQNLFRHYRQEQIFDRSYPLGSNVVTRLQQILAGQTMMAQFKSLSCKDVLRLTLRSQGLSILDSQPDLLSSRTAAYSEVNMPLSKVGVSVSEGLNMLSIVEMDEEADQSVLSKAGWGHFVNIDQISSVVLHSERALGKRGKEPQLHPASCQGVWFTINGPRVCWGKQIRSQVDRETNFRYEDGIGADNGNFVGGALAKGEKVRWFRLELAARSASIPIFSKVGEFPEEGQIMVEKDQDFIKSSKDFYTYLVLTVLGRTFTSEKANGENPQYRGNFVAEVPISFDDQAVAAFDEHEIGIDVVEWAEDPKLHRTIWATKMPLWKLFAKDEVMPIPKPQDSMKATALNTLDTLGFNTLGLQEEVKEDIFSLSHSLRGGKQHTAKQLRLLPPSFDRLDDLIVRAQLDLEVLARIHENVMPPKSKCISPELQGRGPIASLFSSHRGAWYDSLSSTAKLTAGHVPNFVEFCIKELIFPADDRPDQSKLWRYQLEATCNGVRVSTSYLYRSKEIWNYIIPVDVSKINFNGARICVPIPPGVWSSTEDRMKVELRIFRVPQNEAPTLTFRELLAAHGKPGSTPVVQDLVYHSVVAVDGLALDYQKSNINVPFSRVAAEPTQVDIARGDATQVDSPAIVVMDVALRDRDYVRLYNALDKDQPGVICIGDKAMLKLEEPLSYPLSEVEFRKRFLPGEFDRNYSKKGGSSSSAAWTAPLRDPSLSHEYKASSLETLSSPVQFKQRFLPNNSQDIVPFKYVLPQLETEFLRQARPGVYWRIVDDYVNEAVAKKVPPRDKHPGVVVDRLSHLVRHAPVTVLAVYADQTCDVELAPTFLAEWERNPHRHFSIPGSVTIGEFIDTSAAAIRSAPVGAGDVGERFRRRVLLKNVAVNQLFSVQAASFNIYDATISSTEEALKIHPNKLGNDFNPCIMGMDEIPPNGERGSYRIHPGPVPADAGPSATYEWSLTLCAKSEEDMCHFVTGLRQAARMDLSAQLKKLDEFKKKSVVTALNARPYLGKSMLSSKSGNLEVVLIEARHLRHERLQPDLDLRMAAQRAMRHEMNCKAVFSLKNGRSGEDLVYKGSKTQTAPAFPGDNPCWAEQDTLVSSGGWVFKSPPIEPERMQELFFRLELIHETNGGQKSIGLSEMNVFDHTGADGSKTCVCGLCRAGVPRINLTDLEKPFNNIWLPIFTIDPATGDPVPNPSGEIHIMTLWIPHQETAKTKRFPKTARGWKALLLKQKLQRAALFEPVYGIQVQKKGYDPNVEKGDWPRTPAEAAASHIQLIYGNAPYIECCVRQQVAAWNIFEEKLRALSAEDVSLGQWRLCWLRASTPDHERVWEMDELIRRGIPPFRRKKIWTEILRADDAQRSVVKDHDAVAMYQRLVELGKPYRNDAMVQLNEDLVAASSWESSQNHAMMDRHMKRLKRAQDVCIALIMFSQDLGSDGASTACKNYKDIEPSGSSVGVAYCEGLLVLAFWLLVAQIPSESGKKTDEDKELDEVRAFWMLYSLIGAPGPQPFRDYFGVPLPRPIGGSPGTAEQIADRRGAMDDILRLNFCITRYEPELWVHLNALGFHLSTVFFGAFMRCYAFLLPASTLFRFWDLLFNEAARPDRPENKPARHSLIDLAFAILRQCKADLMKCLSAQQVTQRITSCLETMYDPSQAIQMTAEAERFLWDDPVHQATAVVGIQPLHSMDFDRAVELWEGYLLQYRLQNQVLCSVARHTELTAGGSFGQGNSNNANANNNTNSLTSNVDPRVTTRSVMKIINALQHQLQSSGTARGEFGGMMRQIPQKILELAPEADRSYMGQAWSLFTRFQEKAVGQAYVRPKAVGIPAPPNSTPEPAHLDNVAWAEQVKRCVGDAWGAHVGHIFEVFASTTGERRMSLYEFFIALICCSKGTVGEKAIALFHLYAYVQPLSHDTPHIQPVCHSAGVIIERNEGAQRQDEGQLLKAPKDEEIKKMALHFKIYTHGGGASGLQEVLLGEVFIPTLTPYFYNGMGPGNAKTFSIWGTEKRLPPGLFANKSAASGAEALIADHGVRPYMGDMTATIKWMPADPSRPEVGQLGVHLESIRFNPRTVEAPHYKNPRVTLHTYSEEGREVLFRRWDPRSLARKMGQTVTLHAAYSEYVEFPETMRRDPITGKLWNKLGTGGLHGWQSNEAVWTWSHDYGDQYSAEATVFRRDVCKAMSGIAGVPTQRPNTISLQACRLLTQNILCRSLHPITHRQAVLIADQVFSRAGAVPGIIDAIIANGDVTNDVGAVRSLEEAKEEIERTGRKWVDVKKDIIIGHEIQVALNRGDINILPVGAHLYGEDRPLPMNLSSLKIQDPFPGERKVLLVRYCRSGDGQRLNAQIRADQDANFQAGDIQMDMDLSMPASKVQMSITKEEFVNCLLGSPLLSESLRQLSTTDNSTKNVQTGLPIKLDVVIADPTKEEADEDLMDAMNIRQAVLFELWDSDIGKQLPDFLGECWLPPLGSAYIGPTPRTFALPVQSAPAEDNQTRPYSRKQGTPPCTGNLFVEASWVFPATAVPDAPEDMTDLDARVKRETALHTGKLKIRILRAEGLRTADKNFRRSGSDPFVRVYIRNEAFLTSDKGKIPPGFDAGGWRTSQITGLHEVIFETSVKKATRNPVWEEETELELMTGAFEKRTKQALHIGLFAAQRQRQHDDLNLAVIGDKEELRIHFGPTDDKDMQEKRSQPGYRHDVQVYIGENMHQFKEKLVMACNKEAKIETDPKRKAQFKAVADQMSYRHAVMVFVPSQRLRELAQQQRTNAYEYKRLYRIEEQDPSSWQPLDTVCTFFHYAAMYSFGKSVAQRLRISDGTYDYKLRNNRFRVFEQEQARWYTRLEDLNNDKQCFGYAKFQHHLDGNSIEWRKVIVDRPETIDVAGGKKIFKANFVHTPLLSLTSPQTSTSAQASSPSGASKSKVEFTEEQILLAPAVPKIMGSQIMEHQDLLAKAKMYQDKGLTEKEIVEKLNEELNTRWEKRVKDEVAHGGQLQGSRPPQIQLSDVQHALKQSEAVKDDEVISHAPSTATVAIR